jgi:uncharacterized protein YoxC
MAKKPKTLEAIREEYEDTLTDLSESLSELQSDLSCLESCETLDDFRDNLEEVWKVLRNMTADVQTLSRVTEAAWQKSGK